MNLHIRPINIFDGELFVHFMDSLDFTHHPDWKGCYCRFYHSDCSKVEWTEKQGLQNRQEAIDQISGGLMHGYMAFDNETPIGWLNAGYWENYPRLKSILSKWANLDTALMICFMIKPEYRRQGVSKALYQFAFEDLKSLGYKNIIAIPENSSEVSASSYRGSKKMYEDHGFIVKEEIDGYAIMDKSL